MGLTIHNLEIVIRNIKSIGGGAEKYMHDVAERCMTLDIFPIWKEHISLQDHSLEDLAKLGHPYSTRLPKDSFIHPDWEVHEQSGTLLAESRIEDGTNEIRLVNTAPEYVFLRYGTVRMRPRDPGGEVLALALPKIKARFAQEVKDAIVKFWAS